MSLTPLTSPNLSSPSKKKKFNFQGVDGADIPYIFLQVKKYRTDTILAASVGLRKRGFAVEVEQESKKDGSCNFLLSLSPALVQKIALTKNYEVHRHLLAYPKLQQLVILTEAIGILEKSCVFLEGRKAWIAHNPNQFDSFLKEKDRTKKLAAINNYFGPQIGLYFGWLYHYTDLLLYPSIFGVLTFAHQYYYNDIDSSWMPFYAIFMAVWTTVFLELSKRNISSLAFEFSVLGQEEENETPVNGDDLAKTLKKEDSNKPFRLLLSFSGIMILMYIMVEVMLYAVDRQLRAEEIYGSEGYWKYLPSIVYSLIPMIGSAIFQPAAEYLTNFEDHSEEEEHERYLVLKLFSLQFVNRYCGLLYIAFYLRDLNLLRSLLISLLVNGAIINNFTELGVPYLMSLYNHYSFKKKKGAAPTSPASSPRNATANGTTTTTNGSTSVQGLFPAISPSNDRNEKLAKKFEIIENELSIADYDLNDDYMEMALQFGYITLFAVAFPLTPLLAFVNNYFEPMVDLNKLTVCRRLRVKIRSAIGAWQTCFEFLSVVAVITNCYLLAMVSTKVEILIPERLEQILSLQTEYGRVLTMLFFEHVLLGLKLVLMAVIDDVPRHIREAIEAYKSEKSKASFGQRVQYFSHEQRSKAYEQILKCAISDADDRIVKEAVLSTDRKMQPVLQVAEQLASEDHHLPEAGLPGPPGSARKASLHSSRRGSNIPLEDADSLTPVLDDKAKLAKLFARDSIGFHPLTLLGIVFIPYLCQYFHVSPLVYIPAALVTLTYFQSQKNRVDRQIAVGIVTDANLLKLVTEQLPSWFHDSEYQRVEWLNATLSKLFPQIANAVEAIVKEKVQPTIDANIPFYLPKLEIKNANLGSVSPKITGIRVFHNHESNVRLDLELKWSSDLVVTLKLHTPPIPLVVELRDLRVTANVRVELLELYPKIPCFRALSVTCMKKPEIDFSLSIASMDIMNMGAGSDYNVTAVVQNIIDSVVAGVCLYPKKILIPMDDKVNLDDLAETPDGILILHLIRGTNLMAVNYMGGSDPYVEFISSRDVNNPVRSTVKYSTVNPDWNETFTFFIYDKNTETVGVTVYDSDITNQMPTPLGQATIHLSLIKRRQKTPQEFNLPLSEGGNGVLRVSCLYKAINKNKKANKLAQVDEHGEAITSDHILFKEVDDEDLGNNDAILNGDNFDLDDEEGDLDDEEDGDMFQSRSISFSGSPVPAASSSGKRFSSMPTSFSAKSSGINRSGSIDDTSSEITGTSSARPTPSVQPSRRQSVGTYLQESMRKNEEFQKSLQLMVGILNISQIKLTNIKLPDGMLVTSTLRLYVTFSMGGKTLHTKYIKNNQSPAFVENFTFLINSLNEELVVNVYNKSKYSMISPPKALGTVRVPLNDLMKHEEDGGRKQDGAAIQKVEQQYMLHGLKEEGFVGFKAVMSLFD